MVLEASPESRYTVETVPVLGCIVDQVIPLFCDLSIMYPVTKLPLLLGAFQFKTICDDETVLAVRPVGDGKTGIITLLPVIGGTIVDVSPEVVDVSPEVVDVREGVKLPSWANAPLENTPDEESKRNPKNNAVSIFSLLPNFVP